MFPFNSQASEILKITFLKNFFHRTNMNNFNRESKPLFHLGRWTLQITPQVIIKKVVLPLVLKVVNLSRQYCLWAQVLTQVTKAHQLSLPNVSDFCLQSSAGPVPCCSLVQPGPECPCSQCAPGGRGSSTEVTQCPEMVFCTLCILVITQSCFYSKWNISLFSSIWIYKCWFFLQAGCWAADYSSVV